MGRFPIQISIISLIFKYYIYLNGKENNSVVKQALIISQELGSKYHNSYHSKLLEILQLSNRIDLQTHIHLNSYHLLKINIENFGNTKLNHLQS